MGNGVHFCNPWSVGAMESPIYPHSPFWARECYIPSARFGRSTANLAPEAPAVALTPEVTAGTSLEELDVSGAKRNTRFMLPFDFPNQFIFQKSRIPAANTFSQPPVIPVIENPAPSEAPLSLRRIRRYNRTVGKCNRIPLQINQIWM